MGLHALHYRDFDYSAPDTAFYFTSMAQKIAQHGGNPKYLVGSVIFGIDQNNKTFFIPTTNAIPRGISEKFSSDDMIGTGHPSVHAEMHGMALLPPFKQISFALSKPPCPTCLEGLSELRNFRPEQGRVDSIFVDDHCLDNPATQEKWSLSQKMVHSISQKGHIGVFFLHLKAKTSKPFSLSCENAVLNLTENLILVETLHTTQDFDQFDLAYYMKAAEQLAEISSLPQNKEAVIGIGKNAHGTWITIGATASLPPGFTYETDKHVLDKDTAIKKKSYQYKMSAAKRVMMAAIKLGVHFGEGGLICTTPPPSGMVLNAFAYGVRTIVTLPITTALGDKDAMALSQLHHAGLLTHRIINPKNAICGPKNQS